MMDKQKKEAIEQYLKSGDLCGVFVDEIGWDNPSSNQPTAVSCDEKEFLLLPVAEKRDVVIFRCDTIPDIKLRKKIESQAKKFKHEHLIVFMSPDNSKQVWQWVTQKGQTYRVKEHTWQTDKSAEPLIQKLKDITFSLKDEYELTLLGVLERLQSAFDQEKVTKKFYDAFKKEHEKFKGFIEGLTKEGKDLYASLMLNRLMFVYFIQKREFLAGDIHYLKNRLGMVRKNKGRDKFYSFYKEFLLELFHRGLATPIDLRDKKTIELIGKIPYLNGGLFEPHAFEGDGSKIQIPDKAFERIFSFFDEYQWTLDTRLTEKADGNQINPDVLGHIFEKFINQKQMGAYYTKEDITDYITQNTVIPWLFRKVESNDRNSFAPDGFVWKQLRNDPDSYIYKEVAHKSDKELPESISAGIEDVSRRGDWNKASEKYGLPTEIWRETVTRRQRYSDIRDKIVSGKITKIEDLITYNLNISQFAQDVIENTDNPDLVHAFWKAIKSIKVLDPSCGSGAFLFAALNVLHDLYDACLYKMEKFVEDASELKNCDQNISHFQELLNSIEIHPNRSYFIYKEIILYNLYGVDIMNEAVEICKLRLFLKLASKLELGQKIEALPDIDFNIRTGNSLIGYTSRTDIKNVIETEEEMLSLDDRDKEIEETMQKLAEAFASFRQKQTELDGKVESKDKKKLRDDLEDVCNRLDRFLAQDYNVKIQFEEDIETNEEFQHWRKQYQPFHWCAEFYDIIDKEGGFGVIIGNPPYLEASKVDYSPNGFKSRGAIHGYLVEQSVKLLSKEGGMSMILPIALVSTKRMKDVQDAIETNRSAWYSNFSDRPAKLFDGADFRFSIFISAPCSQKKIFTTGYKKWETKAREALMRTLTYVALEPIRKTFWIPKFQNPLESEIFNKVTNQALPVKEIWGDGPGAIYYRSAGVRYYYVFTDFQPKYLIDGKSSTSSTQEKRNVKKEYNPIIVVTLLSSSIFWWWYTIRGDCWHLTKSDIHDFRVNKNIFIDKGLLKLGKEYLKDIKKNSYCQHERRRVGMTQTQAFKIQKSKLIIDKIDAALAPYYNFTAEELDFIQNYDRFRVGADTDEN